MANDRYQAHGYRSVLSRQIPATPMQSPALPRSGRYVQQFGKPPLGRRHGSFPSTPPTQLPRRYVHFFIIINLRFFVFDFFASLMYLKLSLCFRTRNFRCERTARICVWRRIADSSTRVGPHPQGYGLSRSCRHHLLARLGTTH